MSERSYSELRKIPSFEDRYNYLRLRGSVGRDTFAFDRYLNQRFYGSAQWAEVRNFVIARDEARDLGVKGFEIRTRLVVHHMNPISPDHIKQNDDSILDPEYLICTSHKTHNAIHYGDSSQLQLLVERRPGDTRSW